MPTNASERRIIYLKRKKQGNCPRCGARVRKNSRFIYCDNCRSYFRNYFNDIADDVNEVRRSVYAERKKNHQCPRCGKKLGVRYGYTLCQTCLDKQYDYNYR